MWCCLLHLSKWVALSVSWSEVTFHGTSHSVITESCTVCMIWLETVSADLCSLDSVWVPWLWPDHTVLLHLHKLSWSSSDSPLQTPWSASCADQNNSLSIILHLYMLPETSSLSMLHRPKQQLYIKSPLYMPSPSWSALSSMQTPWETSSADQNNSSKSNYIFTCHNELLQNRHHGQDHGW